MSQVLALKYRPKKFDDLIGQDTISTTLSLALDTNRLSHAYLFSGLRGSGKTSTARIMAKALVCEKGPLSNPCDVCANCISANENKHLDIIEMDAASNRGIDDIKSLIEHTKYKPSTARYKVFIIDEVHMLTTQAFNALLKTLEEPPEFVKFILATTDPLKLPATILSRTQHFRFKRIKDKDIIHHLSHILNLENITFEEDALTILARSGEGSLRDTLTLLDQAIIFSKGSVSASAVTDMLGMIDPIFMDKLFETILASQDTTQFLDDLEEFDAGQVIDEMSIFLKYRMLNKDARFDTFLFDRFFRILGDAKQLLAINSDSGFVLILTISKMVEATNIKTIDEVILEVQNQEVKKQSITTNNVAIKHIESTEVINTQENVTADIPTEVEEEIKNEVVSDDLLSKVITNIYSVNPALGECFENSFTLCSYENNILTLNSKAQGECRKSLYKHIMFVKTQIRAIYGENTDVEFNVISTPQEESVSSGCVASIADTPTPTPAQSEVSIDDVLNSAMTQKAVELFQPENALRVNNKV